MNRLENVNKFWNLISDMKFDELAELFDVKAKIYLPNTREVFDEYSRYIEFNRDYPGRWCAKIMQTDQLDDKIIMTTKMRNIAEDIYLFVVSYFVFSTGNKILEITEYWSECGELPEWRNDGKYTK